MKKSKYYLNKCFQVSLETHILSIIYFYKETEHDLISFTINFGNNRIYTQDLWPKTLSFDHLTMKDIQHLFITSIFTGSFKIDTEMKL